MRKLWFLWREVCQCRKNASYQGMKTAKDPRHIKRIQLMQSIFSWQFQKKPDPQIRDIVKSVKEMDNLIGLGAPGRPLEQINKIDLAILRLAVFELIIKKDAPPKVIVDEAVELGKQFGSDSSPAFINGALGKIIEIKKITV